MFPRGLGRSLLGSASDLHLLIGPDVPSEGYSFLVATKLQADRGLLLGLVFGTWEGVIFLKASLVCDVCVYFVFLLYKCFATLRLGLKFFIRRFTDVGNSKFVTAN